MTQVLRDKVIITCALTGGIHGKEANPNLPEQPDEIAEQGLAAWNESAAILHVHARNPDGSNTIINPPQAAILAAGRITERPAVVAGQVVPRPTLFLTLSPDHRVLDGVDAARYLDRVAALIEEPYLLVT